MRAVTLAVYLLIGMSYLCFAKPGKKEPRLETIELSMMNISRSNITLSGFSAGGSMAQHTHLSFSSYFSGIAVFSQAFYLCGHTSLIRFGITCGAYGLGLFRYNPKNSVSDAKRFAKSDLIDPLDNMNGQRVFLWAGSKDVYIPPESVEGGINFYAGIGVHRDNIRYTLFTNASHCLPTENFGAPCDGDANKTYYLGKCDWNGPYYALSYILRTKSLTQAPFDPTRLFLFNQTSFYPGKNIKDISMGTKGFIYIPKKCAEMECMLHLNFHGCDEWDIDYSYAHYSPNVAEEYIKNSGFLPIAEGSGIIMIFPLTTKTNQNMGGCWDFYSYLPNIGTKNHPQVQVMEGILRRVVDGE